MASKQMKNTGQKKTQSWAEVFTNLAIGYSINLVAQCIIFPAFDMHIKLHEQIEIGLIFTVISVARQYCLRRFYNWWMIQSKA